MNNSWKKAMDLLPNGLVILNTKSAIYYNSTAVQLLKISEDVIEDEAQAILVYILYRFIMKFQRLPKFPWKMF